MSDSFTTRIGWLSQRIGQSAIRQATGIPRSTLSYVVRGTRNLPTRYYDTVRKLYARETYARFRGVGMPAHIARGFRYGSPPRIEEIVGKWKDKVSFLSEGWIAKRRETFKAQGIYVSAEDLKEEAEEAIMEGLEQSGKTIEQIYDYGGSVDKDTS